MHPVIGGHHIEEPGHRRLLEPLAARWVHAHGPARRNVTCHEVRIDVIERRFD